MKIKKMIAVLLTTLIMSANAAEYKMLVPFAAGAQSDIAARAVAQSFEKLTGDNLIVENYPGADGLIGVNKFKNDKQYDIIGLAFSVLVINPVIKNDIQYKYNDFDHIVFVGTSPNIWFTKANSPIKSSSIIKDKKILVGGNSTIGELNVNILNREYNSDITYVPYKGSPDVVFGILNDTLPVASIAPTAAMLDLVKAEKIKILGSTYHKRISFEGHEIPSFVNEINAPQLSGFVSIALRPDIESEKREKLKKYLWLAVQDKSTQSKLRTVFILDDSHNDMNKFNRHNEEMQRYLKQFIQK
jgi:tripartite-type tricarboxylate transporter receptor subunit TctC